MLFIKGMVLKDMDISDVWPRWELKSGVITICTVRAEDGEVIGREGVTVQQQRKWHGRLKAILG